MSDYTIEYNAARAIAVQHAADRDAINRWTPSLPEDIDGGDGAEYLLSMLADISENTGALVNLLSVASNQMLVTVDLYQGVEEEAEQVFRTLAEQI